MTAINFRSPPTLRMNLYLLYPCLTPNVKVKQIERHIFIVASQKYRWELLITQNAVRKSTPNLILDSRGGQSQSFVLCGVANSYPFSISPTFSALSSNSQFVSISRPHKKCRLSWTDLWAFGRQ